MKFWSFMSQKSSISLYLKSSGQLVLFIGATKSCLYVFKSMISCRSKSSMIGEMYIFLAKSLVYDVISAKATVGGVSTSTSKAYV